MRTREYPTRHPPADNAFRTIKKHNLSLSTLHMLCGNGRERSETARIPSETLQDGITYADLMRFMTAAYRSGQRDRPSPSNTLGASRWIGMIAFGFGVDHAVFVVWHWHPVVTAALCSPLPALRMFYHHRIRQCSRYAWEAEGAFMIKAHKQLLCQQQ